MSDPIASRAVRCLQRDGRPGMDGGPLGPAITRSFANRRAVALDQPQGVEHHFQMNKRAFLQTAGGAGLSLLLGEKLWAQFAELPAEHLAEEEDFWLAIRSKYRLKPDYINLENGYYSMQATPVLDA